MRAYNVAAVAEALGVDAKQLDNMLSRHDIAGVKRVRQGVTRRLSPDAIVVIRLALGLAKSLRVPLDLALQVARRLEQEAGETVPLTDELWLRADLSKLRADTGERLDRAVEAVVHRSRGRPVTRPRS